MARFGKLMQSTGAGSCFGCNSDLGIGKQCHFDFGLKKRFCVPCVEKLGSEEVAQPALASVSSSQPNVSSSVDLAPLVNELAEIKQFITGKRSKEAEIIREIESDMKKHDVQLVTIQKGDDESTKRTLSPIRSALLIGAMNAALTQEDVLPEW